MLARGIAAQRRGTEVAALSYFYQAAAIDSSLFEASKRSSIMAANISSGNIGADLRNDIVWRKSWIARLEETELTFYSIINSADPPYTLFYSTGIRRGNVNYQQETADLSIPINLSANIAWFKSMTKALQAVQAILNGLNSTNKRDDWGLSNWPRDGVSNTNPFASSKGYDITVAFELVNQQGRVIGSQTIRLHPAFRIARSNSTGINIEFTENTHGTVTFNNVKADDISDNLTVRIASINGGSPRNARFAINALSAEKWKQNTFLQIEKGVVLGFDGSLSSDQRVQYRNLVIPKETWGNPVTDIGERAFADKQLTGLTIPDGIIFIRNDAFANNLLTGVTIPNSVASIGSNAFANNQLTNVTILNSATTVWTHAFANNLLTGSILPGRETRIEPRASLNSSDSPSDTQTYIADTHADRPNRKQKIKRGGGFGMGGYFAVDEGGGVDFVESDRQVTMPNFGAGLHIYVDLKYCDLFIGGADNAGKWEDTYADPKDQPNLSRFNCGAAGKFPLIGIGSLVTLYPLYGIEYQRFSADSSYIKYADGEKYPLDGKDGRPSKKDMTSMWGKFGVGIDLCDVGTLCFRFQTLYGIRLSNNYETRYLEEERQNGREAKAIPGRGLTFILMVGFYTWH